MVTLKQLAKELNISISTVSKALNNSEEISKKTIERVKELANYYNYKPNKVAVSLKSNTTKTIGVVIPNILNFFFAKVLFGIEKEATNQGYNIITCISNESIEKEIESLQLLGNGSVDGFILAVAEETQLKNNVDHFTNTINRGLPLVMFDRVIKDIVCDKVIIDDVDAAYNATMLLLNKGRKKIAYVSNIDDLNVGKLRQRGYEKALNEEGLKENHLILKIDNTKDWQQQIQAFFENNKDMDGIIAADNVSGTIAINMASHFGYKVPKDLSIIGFGDGAFALYSTPKLTMVDQHAEKMGRTAVQLLVKRLKNKEETFKPITKVIATELLENESF